MITDSTSIDIFCTAQVPNAQQVKTKKNISRITYTSKLHFFIFGNFKEYHILGVYITDATVILVVVSRSRVDLRIFPYLK